MRERAPGVWTLRVSVVDPVTGKRKTPSRTAYGSRRQAATELGIFEAEAREGLTIGPILTVEGLFERWIASPAKGGRPRAASSRYQETQRFRRHVLPVLGSMNIRSVRGAHITALYDKLLAGDDSSRQQPLSANSVQRVHQLLSAMFAWAVRRELVSANPVTTAERPGGELPMPRAPEFGEVRRLLVYLAEEDHELWLAARLAATIGARRSELVALRWTHFDLDLGTVQIDDGEVAVPGRGRVATETKTGTSGRATLFLDPELVAELEGHQHRIAATCEELSIEFDSSGYVFCADGIGLQPWHPDTFSSRLARARASVEGAQQITFKSLRAFVASELEGEGADLTTAQAVLRHRSPATTARYYRASRVERVRQATRSLGGRLTGENVVESE